MPVGGPTASMLAATLATEGDCTMPPKLMWPVSPRCGGLRGCGGAVAFPVDGAERESAASSGCCSRLSGDSREFAFCIDSWEQAHSSGAGRQTQSRRLYGNHAGCFKVCITASDCIKQCRA